MNVLANEHQPDPATLRIANQRDRYVDEPIAHLLSVEHVSPSRQTRDPEVG